MLGVVEITWLYKSLWFVSKTVHTHTKTKAKAKAIKSTYHEDEVSHSRRVHSTTSAGAHNHTQLGDHAGRLHVLQEHVSIASKGINSLLDSDFFF
jgi:hypothetical protein